MKIVICPGFMRCGTSTLYNLLVQHPDCCKPYSKELQFFLNDYSKGLKYYMNRLGAASDCNVALDISPAYAIDDEVPDRIKQLEDFDARFIFMVREPARRLKSHYFMNRRLMHEDLSIEKALGRSKDEMIRRSIRFYGNENGFDYLKSSMYGTVVSRYTQRFSSENIKVVIFEEFIGDMVSSMKDICSFLGIDPEFEFDYNVNTNPNKSAARMKSMDKAIKRLKNLTVFRGTNWKTGGLRGALAGLKNRLIGYRTFEYWKDIEVPGDVIKILENEIDLLRQTTGMDYSVWDKPDGEV